MQNLREIVVTGIGLVSALGSLSTAWKRLLKGESGITSGQPFPTLPPLPLGIIAAQPQTLTPLTQTLVTSTLQDAGLAPPLPSCGVVIGSSRGCQGEWEEALRQQQPIKNWLATFPHQATLTAATYLGSQGTVLAPMAACATGIWAIARGWELIQTGQCTRALVGAVEAPLSPLTLTGFLRMGALAKTGCRPFDRQREGLVLGEGGAMLMLETADSAQERGATIYGQILGFGLTADGHHLSAPDPSRRSGLLAVKQCLQYSQLEATDIDYIHAHGTSTKLNDAHEAELIQRIFPPKVAVSSTKGATGHTLGASGAIGTAFCLLALREQLLPPCVGLKEPEFNLNLVRESRSQKVKRVLCFSFGFGGQNAVLALGKRINP